MRRNLDAIDADLAALDAEISLATRIESRKHPEMSREDWLRIGRRTMKRAARANAGVRQGILLGVNDTLTACGFTPTTMEELTNG